MADPRAPINVTLAASVARLTSGTGDTVDLYDQAGAAIAPRSCVRLYLDVSAIAGAAPAPTLTVSLETSRDGLLWRALDAFDVVAAISSVERLITGASRYVRAKWVITGGTGHSFTFQLAGIAYLVYATPGDVKRLALPADAITDNLTDQIIGEGILAACDEIDGITADVVTYPLASWGRDRTLHVAKLATKSAMDFRGYAPQPGARDVFKDGRDAAIAWAESVRDQKRSEPATVDATPDDNDGAVTIITKPKRGWGRS